MEELKVTIHNVETGEVTTVPMTEQEVDQHFKDREQTNAMISEQEAKKVKRAQILERLGLTEEEAKLLLL